MEDGTIRRANLDGSQIETLVSDLPGFATAIALDVAAGKMYWGFLNPNIDSLFPASIMRSNLDGSDTQEIVSSLTYCGGVALDLLPGKLYWSDLGLMDAGVIQRSNLDGSQPETLVTRLDNPRGIALEPTPIPEPSVLVIAATGGFVLLLGLGRRGLSRFSRRSRENGTVPLYP
ncbi:MAG: hypothetical protein A2V70_02470 [Planctomycetes bacterium RBG_13_63_9]|nr:MAG: hypothetical protein A2V70_02470 [Planctomycetes bacterium RBG_13_63_9]